MRILLATGAMRPEPRGVPLVDPSTGLSAMEVARALSTGWRTRRPDDVITILPLPDGGPGSAQEIDTGRVLTRRALPAHSPLGEVREVDLLRLGAPGREPGGAGRTWFLDAARLTALPADGDAAAREALDGSTYGVGEVVARALDAVGPRATLVVGLSRSAVHDGGQGVIDGLGGPGAARRLLGGRDLLLALADGIALGGLSGAGQDLAVVTSLSPARAQELDRAACATASRLISLLGSSRSGSLPLADETGSFEGPPVSAWGTGASGGGAAILRALGARVAPGPRVMAELLGLARATGGQDLVVTSAGEVYDVLADGVPAVVGAAAQARALPVVLVAGRSLVPRGELAAAGIVSAYSLEGPGAPDRSGGGAATDWNRPGPAAVHERLVEMGSRLARSWSR